MSRRALGPPALGAAREAFIKRHPSFVGDFERDPERVAYLDETLTLVVRAYAGAAPPDLFVSRRGS